MSIINPGDFPIDPQIVDGTELAERLNRLQLAVLSCFSNPTRPADILAGGLWTKTTAQGLALMLFDGSADVEILSFASGSAGLSTPMLKASRPSFTGTNVGSTEIVDLTVDYSSGITKVGTIFTPTVHGWYQCSINAQCTGETAALGLAVVATNDSFIQVQPPYANNNAYVSAGGLTYCNGTTDTIKFGVFGSVAGCSFTGIKASAVLVRRA